MRPESYEAGRQHLHWKRSHKKNWLNLGISSDNKKNTLNEIFEIQSGTYIIAEIGINHEGSVERCADMIKAFARAGADAIKLQTVDADKSYAPDT